MKLQVTGCNEVTTMKGQTFTLVYGIELNPIKKGFGYRPYAVTRNNKTNTALWIPLSYNIPANKELLNKVLNVSFNANGYLESVEIVK